MSEPKIPKVLCVLSVLTMILPRGYTMNYCQPYLTTAEKFKACSEMQSDLKPFCILGLIALRSQSWGANCPSNAHLLNLTIYQSYIVHLHNEKRNKIAAGSFKNYGFKTAARMGTMRWDDSLVFWAKSLVKQCEQQEGTCYNGNTNTATNIGFVVFSETDLKSISYRKLIGERIDMWFQLYKQSKMSYIDEYPGDEDVNKSFNQFAIMVTDRNTRVGCAASIMHMDQNSIFIFACNYGATIEVGQPVYTAGKPISGCQMGKNLAYLSLCSKDETYRD